MLRKVLIVISGLALGTALVADWMWGPGGWPATLAAAIVFIGMVFENRPYQRLLDHAPGPGWQATAERFIDPASGRTVTVFFNAATGERRYVSPNERSD